MAKQAIDKEPKAQHSAETLAKTSGVSTRTLQYGFQQFLNISVKEYIRSVRLEGARKTMLDEIDRSLTDISDEWGFSNVSRFSAYFLAVYGQTPKTLRSTRGTTVLANSEE